jgi:stearoyl-CoA desaturase (delta-9 desaturase)
MKSKSHRWNLAKSLPFFAIHAAALGVFLVPFSWRWVALCLTLYVVRMFAITAGYHRYFAHRSYKMKRLPQFLMALLGTTATQKGALWWAAHHRVHHRHSDQPQDVHSPVLEGFWQSHVGWILSDAHDETRWELIPDLTRYPELVWLNRFHLVPAVALGAGLALVGGLPAFFWGFALSTVLLWHGTFFINSLAHVWGARRYSTTDDSRNNFWLALITLGEGWHNNHHAYMSATRQGFFWWEIDLSYYALKTLSWLGIVSDLRQPPLALLEARRLRPRGTRTASDLERHPLAGKKPLDLVAADA